MILPIKYGCKFFSVSLNKKVLFIVTCFFLLLITVKAQRVNNGTGTALKRLMVTQDGNTLDFVWELKIHGAKHTDSNLFIRSSDLEKTRQRLKSTGEEVVQVLPGLFKSSGSTIKPSVLQTWAELTYIGYESATPVTEATVLDLNLNPNGFNLLKQEYPEITGAGYSLSIQELRFSEEDIDLLGRTRYPDLADPRENDHATQMATIIGGAGNSFVTGLGVLPEVTLISSGFDDPIPDPTSHYQEFNIQVQNHSYGTSIESFYGAFAQLFDVSANDNPDLLHVFSSGNSGLEVAESGTYEGLSGYANLTGNFKMAKNNLVVGAVDTVGRINTFVSNGPAYDGRIKPEVVAYSVSGSSNSAAMVSGLAGALQLEHQRMFTSTASSALVKSLIINAADDAGPMGLDHQTGFGNADAIGSMRTLTRQQFTEGVLQTGQINEHEIVIPENATHFKITLVWNDPAANAGDERALVNDLDLTVKSNDQEFLPWVLNTEPDLHSLESPATRGEDHLNNVEQITVSNPSPMVLVSVSASLQTQGQAYALAYEWEQPNQFEWRYPLVNDHMPYNGETDGYFRWSTTYEAASGELSISYDKGLNWQVLEAGVELDRGLWRWNAPDTTTIAVARMRFSGEEYRTDSFVVGPTTRPSIGFDCGDSSLLQWTKADAAERYQLFELIDDRMQPIAELNDTLFLLNDEEVNSGIYAITPLLDEEKPALRSAAFEVSRLSAGCYFSSFFSEILPEEGIGLNLQLGSTYQVEELVFERFDQGEFQLVDRLRPTATFSNVLDQNPNQGFNLHRAGLMFQDGRTLYTDTITTYFLTQKAVLTFPNPIRQGENLNVFTRAFQDGETPLFELVDGKGKLYIRQPIVLESESIPLGDLSPGLYFYRVSGLGRDIGGRIVVR